MLDKLKDDLNKQIPESLVLDYAMLKGLEMKKSDRYIASTELSIHSKIVQSDLSLLGIHYKKTNSEIEKKFYARISATMIYEYLSDVNYFLGNKLRKELTKNNMLELAEIAKTINKEFSDFKNENIATFKFIRNELGAHKTKNTEILIMSVFEIDDEKIMDLTAAIILINNKLFSLLTKINQAISEYHKINGQL